MGYEQLPWQLWAANEVNSRGVVMLGALPACVASASIHVDSTLVALKYLLTPTGPNSVLLSLITVGWLHIAVVRTLELINDALTETVVF